MSLLVERREEARRKMKACERGPRRLGSSGLRAGRARWGRRSGAGGDTTFIGAINWAEECRSSLRAGRLLTLEAWHRLLTQAGVLGQSLMVRPLDETQALGNCSPAALTRDAGLSLADRACLALADSYRRSADAPWAKLDRCGSS